ncbi:unnamed protein product [Rotaria sp. Silwood2]|nr:unnamed protein product [Rotaria sp. Silwood2]CAF2554980.1 unnamed protein product [Rotaria sp. Silwood2]CAF2774919.1 unnamed protein product [Rotaria sp. Silwood2]CAF2962184.1 unnamed protein product [Rotaria sp. Silwood2]CAF3927342.1 unnamed protein product [Rotaria sp. Silwood2]
MDLFAVILITITAVTICGICLFIFVCAFQPKFLRKLHGKSNRTHQDSDSNISFDENDDHLSVKSLDLAFESNNLTKENSSLTNGRDKTAYLKSLERSLRTGRRIQDDEDNENNNKTKSYSNPLNCLRHFINKHIRRRTSDIPENTEL